MASTTNLDMRITRLSLDNHQPPPPSDLSGILKLSGDSIFSDYDLLQLILARVPLKKLTQFKCVSKPWLFLINNTHFRSMLPLPPRFGFFLQQADYNFFGYFKKEDPVYYFPLPMHNGFQHNEEVRTPRFCPDLFGVGGQLTRILDCSHGLLLCSSKFKKPEVEREHYIYNPTTQELATLPRPSDQSTFCSLSMILAFHSSYAPHYKIIACALRCALRRENPHVNQGLLRQFEIYSSETKSWRVSGQPFLQPRGIRFMNGIYYNGSVYFLCALGLKASNFNCWYFNVEDERLRTFPSPPIATTFSLRRSMYFGEYDDHLHFIEVCPHATVLHVYEMECDHSGWFVKYQVDLAPLFKAFPESNTNEYKVVPLSLVRRDKFEEDSFLVLGIFGMIISYNLVNGSLKEICGRYFGPEHTNVWPYVESLLSV